MRGTQSKYAAFLSGIVALLHQVIPVSVLKPVQHEDKLALFETGHSGRIVLFDHQLAHGALRVDVSRTLLKCSVLSPDLSDILQGGCHGLFFFNQSS